MGKNVEVDSYFSPWQNMLVQQEPSIKDEHKPVLNEVTEKLVDAYILTQALFVLNDNDVSDAAAEQHKLDEALAKSLVKEVTGIAL